MKAYDILGTVLSALHILSHINLTITQRGRCHFSHLTHEETGAHVKQLDQGHASSKQWNQDGGQLDHAAHVFLVFMPNTS